MNILLDECVPWPLHTLLAGHQCPTAQQCGCGGIANGDLLKRAESQFDLFITSDQNMQYQQNLTARRIAILMLTTNKWRPILAAQSLIQSTVNALRPGEFKLLTIPPAP